MRDDLFFADVCVCCGCMLPEGEIICNRCKKEVAIQFEALSRGGVPELAKNGSI